MEKVMEQGNSIFIEEIIEKKQIETQFQPILSAKKNKVAGLEALSRGYHAAAGWISPVTLFSQAAAAGLSLELDRLCRAKALEAFAGLHSEELLFLNIDTGVIAADTVGSKHLLEAVQEAGIKPQQVVIEIVEAKASDVAALKQFIHNYKEYGFTIAIDDIGNGYSNLDRILQIKPDILKIDRGLCRDIGNDYYKQEIFTSLVSLSRRIGALVVAEGVETKEEVMMSFELGADLLQGYYFAKPQKLNGAVTYANGSIFAEFKKSKIDKIRQGVKRQRVCESVMTCMLQVLEGCAAENFSKRLQALAEQYNHMEYLYIVDAAGVQVTDSICSSRHPACKNHSLFQVAGKGADQSLKDYYLHMMAGKDCYISEPYLSLATGNVCITSSAAFTDREGRRFIVCADFEPRSDF